MEQANDADKTIGLADTRATHGTHTMQNCGTDNAQTMQWPKFLYQNNLEGTYFKQD